MKKAFVVVVDDTKMFDTIKDVGNASVGSRLARAVLQGGEISATDALGLLMYGIEIRPYTGPDLECDSCDITPQGHQFDCPEAQQ